MALSIFFAVTVFTAGTLPAAASSFLSRAHGQEDAEVSAELQTTILQQIEETLGKRDALAEHRLARIEDQLRVTFRALPKNDQGKVSHAGVRYALHSHFVQRHSWHVRGLAETGENFSKGAAAPPTGTLQEQVEEFVQGVFEQRFGAHGLNLREMSALVATFEDLVHQEMLQRVNATFMIMRMQGTEEMNISKVNEVLDVYMMGYIMGISSMVVPRLDMMWSVIERVYPNFNQTQVFVREVREQTRFHQEFFSRFDVEEIVERVGDQYGRWQDKECHNLKQKLLAVEDKSIGTNGSGRVRLTDFYGSAMDHGNWQFSESQDYLTELGALDARDPNSPRVIIPNYINSPSNCLASSKYYSVCCMNECEDLFDHLEHHFSSPVAPPHEIASFIASLPSSSVPAGRQLHATLLARLDEIAQHHGGQVPLHGRLFAQWMHHAYPRECPYPHIAGTVSPRKPRDYRLSTKKNATVSKVNMPSVLEAVRFEAQGSTEEQQDECAVWSHHEELYVDSGRPASHQRSNRRFDVRPVAYFCIFAATVVLLVRRVAFASDNAVWEACGLSGYKELFV